MVPETTFLSNVICVLIFGLQVPFVAFFKQLYHALTTLSGEFGLRPCALKKGIQWHTPCSNFGPSGMSLSVVLGLALIMRRTQ
jgi:hypothetical protein